jgi:hypothetical protein
MASFVDALRPEKFSSAHFRGGLSRSQIDLLSWKFSGSKMAHLSETSLMRIGVNSRMPMISLWELCVMCF